MPAKPSIVMRRQLASLALFFAMVLPFAFGLMLSGYQTLLKYSVTRRFEDASAISIVLPANALVWKKKNKELWIDKMPFDIQAITYKADGTAIVAGFFDEDESWAMHLLHGATKQLRNHMPQQTIGLSFMMLMISPMQLWPCKMPVSHKLQAPCCYVDTHIRTGFAMRRLRPPALLA